MKPASSIDPREVEHYRSLAATWWDEQGPFWPLHRLNAVRVPFIREQVCRRLGRDSSSPRPFDGLSVLDIGCGGGILSESVARLGASVHGIDVVDRNIVIARDHAQRSEQDLDLTYELTTAESLAETGARYDVVLNMEVVEHVADLAGFMAACCRLLRPGGVMFIATINRTPLAWLLAIFGAERVLGWMPKGTHRYDWLRKPAEIEALLARSGLAVRDMTGVAVNPFRKQLFLTRSTQVNYMLSASHEALPAGTARPAADAIAA